jgi:hypothetical protein
MATEEVKRPQQKNNDMAIFAAVINTALSTGGDVVQELIRTAQSNPIVGIFLVYLLCDVAQDKGLIHGDSVLAVKGIILAAAGLELTSEIVTALSDLVPSAGTKAVPSLLTPTATTIVNTSDKVDPASAAELGKK